MSRDITEYDAYEVKLPYVGKELTQEEKLELSRKKEEAKKKTLEFIKSIK